MSLLDDILAKLDAMPAEAVDALKAKYVENRPVWLPNVGAQAQAYYSPADVLLYGGSGGGGKSDIGLGLAFTAHRRSLILRRRYANLSALTERAVQINGSRNGFNGTPPPLLRTTVGGIDRYIQFGANQHLGDEQDWQGHPFDFKCVGRGTKVLMAGGGFKPIETLVVGDEVETLEGPRRVTRIIPPRWDEAVRVVASSDCGRVWSQDQSLTHEVLTPAGWVCHGKSGAACPSSISEPTGSSVARTLSRWFALPSAIRMQHRGRCVGHWRHTVVSRLEGLRRFGLAAMTVFEGGQRPGTAAAVSYASLRAQPPLRGSCALQGLPRPNHGSHARMLSRNSEQLRGCDVGFLSTLQGWLGRCWLGSRRYGEHAHRSSSHGFSGVAGLSCLRLQHGAGQPSPNCSGDGDRGGTPRRSLHTGTYDHPYTKEIRRIAPGRDVVDVPFSATPIGKIELFDIEVEEVNHYITEGGIINRNCFDEATQFLEAQVRFHIGWLRSTEEGQRTRALLATNPPIDSNGDWVIGMFRPWLDLTHANPAKPGELRWYVSDDDGGDVEIPPDDLGKDDKGRPCHKEWTRRDGTPLLAMSRTFIPAALKDNPYLANTDYGAKLDGLPEPLRSAVRDGNFMAARSDADFQVIPTQWVIEAQARWKPDGFKQFDMTAMALDPAGGGKDSEELTWRHGPWFAEPISAQGEKTSGAQSAVVAIFVNRRNGAPVVIDAGGGYAGAVIERLEDNSVTYIRFNGASSGLGRTRDSGLPYANKRAETWWKFREALDPSQPGGSEVCLPPDPELCSDLTTPCLDTKALEQRGVIQIESKESIRKRIGRSPGKGDAVVMCWSEGSAAVKKALRNTREARPAFANVGHASVKGHRFRR